MSRLCFYCPALRGGEPWKDAAHRGPSATHVGHLAPRCTLCASIISRLERKGKPVPPPVVFLGVGLQPQPPSTR